MDSARRSFLDEIIENPDDDDARLIYADWLEEQGDSRGEFIRVQVELAQTEPLDDEYFDLKDRSDELLNEHEGDWAAELKQDVRKIEFNRGFIDTLTIKARAFVKEADELFRSVPVHWLRFNYLKGQGLPLAQLPALSQIRSLDLDGLKIPDEDLLALLSSPHLSSLEELKLCLPLSEDAGGTLASSPSALTLQKLFLGGYNAFPAGFLRQLAESEYPKLRQLSLSCQYDSENRIQMLGRLQLPSLDALHIEKHLTSAEVDGLCQLPLYQLRNLELRNTRLSGQSLARIAEQGAFDAVQKLVLTGCDIPVSNFESLFYGERLQSCEHLEIPGAVRWQFASDVESVLTAINAHYRTAKLKTLELGRVNNVGLKSFAECECLSNLRRFHIHEASIAVEDAKALRNSSMMQHVREVSLEGVSLPLDAMRALCATQYPSVVSLVLSSHYGPQTDVREEALIHLISSGAFPNLRFLSIDSLRLTDATLKALVEDSSFTSLRKLSFRDNRATQESVRAVLTSDRLPRLKRFDVTDTRGMTNRPKLNQEFDKRINT